MRLRALSAAAPLLVATLVACGGDDNNDNDSRGGRADFNGYGNGTNRVDIDTAESSHSNGGSSWTILVYMVADNNLEPFGMLDLEEMMEVGNNANFRIVVEVDRIPGYYDGPVGNIPDFTGTKRFLVRDGSLQELDDLGEVDTGDSRVLADFISWGVEAYPADKYGIILWDHGSAWPGFGGDETSDYNGLQMSDLANAFNDGLTDAGLSSFNFVGFDACLMGSLETALTLRPYAEYLLASEELEPGHGWDYNSFQRAFSTPSVGTIDLTREIVDGFRAQANSPDWETGETITLSVVDLYNLKAVERALRDLQEAFRTDQANDIARARLATLEFGVQPDPQDSAGMIDLSQFASNIATPVPALAGPSAALVNGIAAAVVYNVTGSATAAAEGIAVYWPRYRSYYNDAYGDLGQMEYWRAFLDAVQEQTSQGSGGQFAFEDEQVSTADAGNGYIAFFADLTAASVPHFVNGGLYYGVIANGDSVILVGDNPAQLDGSTVISSWDLTSAIIYDAGSSDRASFVYYSLQLTNDGGALGTIPLTYVVPGEDPVDLLFTIIFDSSGNIAQETYYTVTAAGYGELTPAAGGIVYPVLVVGGADGLEYQTSYDRGYELSPTATPSYGLQEIGFDATFSPYAILFAQDAAGELAALSWVGDL